jgi:uncharacterized protein YhaN
MTDTKEVKDLKKELNKKEKEIKKHKDAIVKSEKEIEKQIQKHEGDIEKTAKEIEKHKEINEKLISETISLRKRLREHADYYVIESRRAISTALLAAFAFLMALSWREYIIVVIDSIEAYSPVQGKLISALIVTLICVIGIVLVTRFLLNNQ